jgi:exonuclease VII small subunit
MEWHIIDAFNLAMDMYKHGEITLDKIDKTIQTLWEEMQKENAE